MDRREAVRGLKNETQTRDIPIIGMAAHTLDSEREQAIAAGCDEFDVKPGGSLGFPLLKICGSPSHSALPRNVDCKSRALTMLAAGNPAICGSIGPSIENSPSTISLAASAISVPPDMA
jgi:hypothetical protein